VRTSILPNELIDFEGGQNTVFNPSVLASMLANCSYNPPGHTGNLRHAKEGYDRDESLRSKVAKDIKFVDAANGSLKLWCPLLNGRPPQDTAYVMGADVSNGLSSSNSAATIIDVIAGARVGTWASAQCDPVEFSRVLVQLALWFGGRGGSAMICWERNGPGMIVGKYLAELSAPRLYSGEDGQAGWYNNRQSKRVLAEELALAYQRGRFRDSDPQVLEEAADWIHKAGDWVGPSRLARQDSEAQATHGDRVVATMIAWHIAEHAMLASPKPKPKKDPEQKALDEMLAARKPSQDAYLLLKG